MLFESQNNTKKILKRGTSTVVCAIKCLLEVSPSEGILQACGWYFNKEKTSNLLYRSFHPCNHSLTFIEVAILFENNAISGGSRGAVWDNFPPKRLWRPIYMKCTLFGAYRPRNSVLKIL